MSDAALQAGRFCIRTAARLTSEGWRDPLFIARQVVDDGYRVGHDLATEQHRVQQLATLILSMTPTRVAELANANPSLAVHRLPPWPSAHEGAAGR